MNIKNILEQLIRGENLSSLQMQEMIQHCMNGDLSDIAIGAFLALMRMKGETVEELTVAAKIMKTLARPIYLGEELIDIVGTGGDNKNTFNVSTISSFVVAAAGVNVAKHGNHSVSSRSGSADLLISAGFELNLSDENLRQSMQKCGITFLFAPHFNQAMQHVRHARQQLGIRTLFNLLGPLLNPANVKRQVVGVYAYHWLNPIAQVLANLGSVHTMVVNSRDGMDEISIASITDVVEYHQGEFKEWTINPKDYGCAHPSLDEIVVKTPAQSLALGKSVFDGKLGPARDIILLNSAAALYCAGTSPTFGKAIDKAAAAIDSGLAGALFEDLRRITNQEI